MEISAGFPTIQAGQTSAVGAPEQPSQPASPGAGGAVSDFFISPVLRFDSRSLTVIFQVRDSRSGDVIRQFPPETVVARYRQDPSARPFTLPSPGTEAERGEEPVPAAVRQDAGDSVGAPVRSAAGGAAADPGSEPVDLVA